MRSLASIHLQEHPLAKATSVALATHIHHDLRLFASMGGGLFAPIPEIALIVLWKDALVLRWSDASPGRFVPIADLRKDLRKTVI